MPFLDNAEALRVIDGRDKKIADLERTLASHVSREKSLEEMILKSDDGRNLGLTLIEAVDRVVAAIAKSWGYD